MINSAPEPDVRETTLSVEAQDVGAGGGAPELKHVEVVVSVEVLLGDNPAQAPTSPLHDARALERFLKHLHTLRVQGVKGLLLLESVTLAGLRRGGRQGQLRLDFGGSRVGMPMGRWVAKRTSDAGLERPMTPVIGAPEKIPCRRAPGDIQKAFSRLVLVSGFCYPPEV